MRGLIIAEQTFEGMFAEAPKVILVLQEAERQIADGTATISDRPGETAEPERDCATRPPAL